MERITVERAYLDALLRRANFHASGKEVDTYDLENVCVSKHEYDSLIRTSIEFQTLKNTLILGGVSAETLALLIDVPHRDEQRHDSIVENEAPGYTNGEQKSGIQALRHAQCHQPSSMNSSKRHRPDKQMAPPSIVDDDTSDEDVSVNGDAYDLQKPGNEAQSPHMRTLFFSGLSDRTTYSDLLSVIKGGKVVSMTMRDGRHAAVTFLDGASDFLAWTKRNDIYLHTKRVEVKWADRQFRLNSYIKNKIAGGATRNLVIFSAMSKDITEEQIRDDMEHIHNLVVIDVTWRNGDAYVRTNSVHNALYARTCMMSRSRYKGCKIAFFRDECDVPLPPRNVVRKAPVSKSPPTRGDATLANRFQLLNMDDQDRESEEEVRSISEGSDAGVDLSDSN